MANYAVLKAAVEEVVKTNGNEEITGANLQSTLLSIINSLGTGYQFMGVATPSTNPSVSDEKIFYIASDSGVYENFGGIELSKGIHILKYDLTWTASTIIGFDDGPLYNSENVVVSGGVDKNLSILPKFTASRYIYTDGTLRTASSSTYTATEDYYPVVGGMKYYTNIRCDVSTNTCIAFYDENKTFLSYTNVVGQPFTAPAGAKYARFSDFNNTVRDYRYIKPEFNDAKDVDMFILSLVAESDAKYNVSENISITHNRFVDNYGNVRVSGSANYVATDAIKVVGGSTITIPLSAPAPNCYHAFFDGNNNLVSVIQGQTTFAVPSAACYARFSGYVSNTSLASVNIDKTIQNVYEVIQELMIGLENKYFGGLANSMICWGDSLTQGAGSDMTHNLSQVLSVIDGKGVNTAGLEAGCTYPAALSKFTGLPSYNFGVGGESAVAIASRAGANPLYNTTEITIPVNGSAVFNKSVLRTFWDDNTPGFTWQNGRPYGINVNGHPCNLSRQDSTYWTLTLATPMESAFTIKTNTPMLLYGSEYRNPKWAFLWCYTNGGYSSVEDLEQKIDKMLKVINPQHFVILGTYAWSAETADAVKTRNKALQAYYGCNFFDTEQYLTSDALADFGITPTTDSDLTPQQIANGVISDVECMSTGVLPSSLWRWCYGVDEKTQNDLHLNAAGYAIVAYKIYELMKLFG